MGEGILNVHGLNVGDTEFDELMKAKANEIGSRPPYMYTSLCPDPRFRAPVKVVKKRWIR